MIRKSTRWDDVDWTRTDPEIARELGVSRQAVWEQRRKRRIDRVPVGVNREHLARIGRLGGLAVSRDRDHMAAIGRKGGKIASRDPHHMATIGQKGGKAVSRSPEHMAAIGQKGGKAPHRRRRIAVADTTAEQAAG